MPRPRPLPSTLDDAGFRVADARLAGVTPRRLRASDLEAPFHGVRISRRTLDARALIIAYAPKLRPGEAISHASALALVGVPSPSRSTRAVHVTTTTSAHERARGAGVHGHEMPAGRLRIGVVGTVRTVHPVDAWCQLGATLSVRELVGIADALTRRKAPISTRAALLDAVEAWSGRRGVRRLRAAADLTRERTDSPRETELRLDAAEAGLPEPEVNGEIRDRLGRFVAFGDLVYREFWTVLEYDGEQHRLDDAQFARDVERLETLARLGWTVIRVTKTHRGAARPQRLDRVRESLISHGWNP